MGGGGFSGGLSGDLGAWKHDLPASNKHLLYVPVITLRNKHNVRIRLIAARTSI